MVDSTVCIVGADGVRERWWRKMRSRLIWGNFE